MPRAAMDGHSSDDPAATDYAPAHATTARSVKGEPVGFLDKVKEKAAEAIEQGKDVAQSQQQKLQLKKLESEEEAALAAFGNAAYSLWESGSLSMSSDLGPA